MACVHKRDQSASRVMRWANCAYGPARPETIDGRVGPILILTLVSLDSPAVLASGLVELHANPVPEPRYNVQPAMQDATVTVNARRG